MCINIHFWRNNQRSRRLNEPGPLRVKGPRGYMKTFFSPFNTPSYCRGGHRI